MAHELMTFRLSDEFVASYADRPVPWGFDCGGGNSLGELTFLTKYSRVKEDGTKERWHECCRRVVEGVYSILKNHCQTQRTPWNHPKAHRAAEEMYERLFMMKWTPPGRGLWMMGTDFVWEEGSAALQNCMFLSTEAIGPRNPTLPFVRLMEASMLGVGVGFDTLGAGAITLHEPSDLTESWTIPDSREGWCDSVDAVLRSYFLPNQRRVEFDYGDIRPEGSPIKRFGGTAAGPGPLRELHESLRKVLGGRDGQPLTSTDIVDIMNLIGRCVVAGNVRRSAELALGLADDKPFLLLKDWNVNPERMADKTGWGNISNNSIVAEVGAEYDHLVPQIALNGEPGLVYLDLMRSHGRLADPANNRDYRAKGCNPCAEQTLEDHELCTLVETYPIRNESIEDYLRTLKAAYLYGKAVTLLPTHWPESNEVMTRNRRIGCSMSGLAQFVADRGWTELRRWMEMGYAEITGRDRQYSEWLGVRESIKKTSIKPSGTVSLLAGVTPGVHWPEHTTYIRRMRFAASNPMVKVFEEAGYWVEPDVKDPDGVVVAFPTKGPQVRSVHDVTVWEKVSLAADVQKLWADNMVSATFTFTEKEKDQIGPLLHAFDGQLKTMSFLPLLEVGGAYKQMPYEAMTNAAWEAAVAGIKRIDYEPIYTNGVEPEGDRYCTNDTCLMEPRPKEPPL